MFGVVFARWVFFVVVVLWLFSVVKCVGWCSCVWAFWGVGVAACVV